MLAIFKTGGKQYSVKSGQKLKIEKVSGKKGDNLSFDKILAIVDDKENIIGTPLIKGALIKATILNQIRDKKIIVFKKRKRQNYRSTKGHRQYLTLLKIDSIEKDNKTGSKQISQTKDSKAKNIVAKKVITNIKKKKNTKKKLTKKTTKSKK